MTTVQADEKTLVLEVTSNDPYGWLSGDDSYQLPPEWLAMMGSFPGTATLEGRNSNESTGKMKGQCMPLLLHFVTMHVD